MNEHERMLTGQRLHRIAQQNQALNRIKRNLPWNDFLAAKRSLNETRAKCHAALGSR